MKNNPEVLKLYEEVSYQYGDLLAKMKNIQLSQGKQIVAFPDVVRLSELYSEIETAEKELGLKGKERNEYRCHYGVPVWE